MKKTIIFLAITIAIFAAALPCFAADKKIIILGFDGMDAVLTQQYLERGLLPNFQRLADIGSYSPLNTTNPAESPVAWSAFSIGANPAKTGVFDFLRRMPGSYYPEFATVSASTKPLLPDDKVRYAISAGLGLVIFILVFFILRLLTKSKIARLGAGLALGATATIAAIFIFKAWVPKELPLPVNNRRGDTFWKIVTDAGIPATALRVPIGFPAEDLAAGGKMLSGLGVPDIRQTQGTFTVYTTKRPDKVDTEMGGKMFHVQVMGDRVESEILGPRNFTIKGEGSEMSPEIMVPFTAKIDRQKQSVDVTVQGVTQTIKMGVFSDFFVFDFKLNPLIHIQGIAKFALLSIEPEFKLYLAPLNFNPAKLPATVRISTPPDFAPKLAKELGLYKTLGWQGETWALNELQISEELFLDDLKMNMADIEKILFSQLEKNDSRLYVCIFEETDRMQHMFWRFLDEQHPLYSEDDAKRYRPAIEEVYKEVDRIVGKVMDRFVDEDTHFIVLSDHGFKTFRKAININTWLVRNGFMFLDGQKEGGDDFNLQALFGQGEFWPNVDWSRTKAYHLGLGQIYINMFGREPQGAVLPAEYESLQDEIVAKLLAWNDPEDGRNILVGAYKRQDIYKGPYFDLAPDIVLGFNEGYRISWQSSLGGIPKDLIETNDRKWSGDHCSVDPHIMHGIYLSNRKITKTPHIMDIAPTVLKDFGLPPSDYMDGKALY